MTVSPQGGEVEFYFVFVSCLASVFVCLFDLPASFCSLIVSNSKMESPSPGLWRCYVHFCRLRLVFM